MSDQTDPRPPRSRRTAFVVIAVLAVLIVGGVVAGIVAAQPHGSVDAGSTTPAAVPSAAGSGAASVTPSAAPVASSTTKAKAPKPVSGTPTPQPTKSATLKKPATIVKSLTASVTKQVAVEGQGDGPGEIAGPAVRITVAIQNATGKTVDLSNTVVNAYYGSASTPALQLEKPGAKAFPASVKSGSTATGVFVFTIPKSQRKNIEVTVDTSTANPVVAFRGSAP